MKTIQLDQEDLDALNKLADEGGKQQRITSPPWGSDFVSGPRARRNSIAGDQADSQGFPHFYGKNNVNAPEGARLLAGKSGSALKA